MSLQGFPFLFWVGCVQRVTGLGFSVGAAGWLGYAIRTLFRLVTVVCPCEIFASSSRGR